jgi:hypothetical protein
MDKMIEEILFAYMHEPVGEGKEQKAKERLIALAEKGIPIRLQCIVTAPKGSWRWQNAYSVVEYRLKKRKRDGVWLWYSHRTVVGKSSMPQLRRMGFGEDTYMGGMHHQEV